MLDLGCYLLGVLKLGIVAGALGFAAYRLRQRFLAGWGGSPARLVEVVLGVALLTWLSELLGAVDLFYASTLVAGSVLIGLAGWFVPGGDPGGDAEDGAAHRPQASPPGAGPAGPHPLALLITLGVIAVVVFHWA
ncbi:MAG TPA: hypothetical protein VFB52_15105, partial [Solirubrobacterales bacterium]|nr:hypothetical protein [Solirubrobacterales bacterium]